MKNRRPTPKELRQAHRTLARTHWFIPVDDVKDLGGSRAWDGLVEGKRMLAVATAYFAETTKGKKGRKYAKLWERMVKGWR